MSNFSEFLAIREEYSRVLPDWMDEYEATGNMHHDPYFMNWRFTPIEQGVWSDIRMLGVPFYPQVPVLNYFIDFANPFLKIGIEADGKAWHDYDLDRARDARLSAQGWMIFRIEGHECKRVIEPWEEYAEEDDYQKVHDFYMTTSEGVIQAIKHRYFDGQVSDKYRDLEDATLFEHMSTRPQYPVVKARKSSDGPVRMGDHLEAYWQRIVERQRKAAQA